MQIKRLVGCPEAKKEYKRRREGTSGKRGWGGEKEKEKVEAEGNRSLRKGRESKGRDRQKDYWVTWNSKTSFKTKKNLKVKHAEYTLIRKKWSTTGLYIVSLELSATAGSRVGILMSRKFLQHSHFKPCIAICCQFCTKCFVVGQAQNWRRTRWMWSLLNACTTAAVSSTLPTLSSSHRIECNQNNTALSWVHSERTELNYTSGPSRATATTRVH